ncbi:SNF2-related, N-terminal domain [Sesbania bispinosa]|nr:SNF2-related, N-terminal domain [Sesbania bispinosa]
MEPDDWGLSAEDFDSLERDAFQKIAQLRHSSSSQQQHHSTTNHLERFPSNPLPDSRQQRVDALSQGARAVVLPTSLKPGTATNKDEHPKEVPKISVKFFLHSSGSVAAKFQYDQVVVAAFRRIPKSSWNAKERLWVFPLSSLSEAEKILGEVSGYNVQVENLDPLVQRAVAAASSVPDLRDRYDNIPSDIESKLMPFQREGVRFLLQHGCRALLADEMGLGKTLQAIAVAACVQDSWPVLILAPSSLRLQWASMIQQWLNIPSSDILIVLSQSGGSNKGGFNIVSSNAKSGIHLDGLFNIISYDLVPKLQNMLMASDFKVVIADESHFLKNAQAKRTTASLPVIKVFLDLADKDMKQINALFRELERVKAKIKASNSKEEIYTDSAEAKIPSVLDYVGTVIEAGCKFLIFAHHQPMIDSIHEFLLKKKVGCIRIDGSTPAASRQQLVTEFQEKDAIKAAVLSIKAGGVGLTLTAASTVIFAELSWTPGDLIQAEDRAHRIGQVSSVNIYYLLANDTVDDIIWDVVQSKLENLGQMLDGHEKTLEVSSSRPGNSPAKRKTVEQCQPGNSPAKQKTLDQFVRRCDNMDALEHQSNPKRPRH